MIGVEDLVMVSVLETGPLGGPVPASVDLMLEVAGPEYVDHLKAIGLLILVDGVWCWAPDE